MGKLKKNEFYCVKCRRAVRAKPADICVKTYRNKKVGSVSALKASCKCGTNLTRFISKDDANKVAKCNGRF